MAGIFYGVGVGPGDPELLTLKAVNVLKKADIIIAPKTEKNEDSIALSIARPYIRANVEIVQLTFPMVFDNNTLSEAWESNKNIMQEMLAAGKIVVFLTLGDPMVYSTYIYIFKLLKNSGCSVETIPGITSFCAIGSKLGYPLAEGNGILSIIPATITDEKLEEALALSDHIVLMKVYKNFPELVAKLSRHGLADKAVMLSNYGLEGEAIVHDLTEKTDQQPAYLSTILARKN